MSDHTLDESAVGSQESKPTGINDAFMLGWSIVELKGRIQVAALDPTVGALTSHDRQAAAADSTSSQSSAPDQLETTASDAFWLASVWRVTFNRTSQLQVCLFPDSKTENTRYDLEKDTPAYLYPAFSPNYTQLGVREPDPQNPILKEFALYDATRRAINCLTLLYLQPEMSLIREVVLTQQKQLVKAIVSDCIPDQTVADDPLSSDDLHTAIERLSARTVLFIDAWDGYLHESFYASGVMVDDQTRLIAYRAGRALSALSWQISVNCVPQEKNTADHPDACLQKIRDSWLKAFEERNISTLQHQLAVIGTALDAARNNQIQLPQPSTDDRLIAFAPELPSAAIESVRRSLDYWQRSVDWLKEREQQADSQGDRIEVWRKLRCTLIAQVSIWQALVTGQEELRTFSAENVTKRILQDVMASFERVVLQQGVLGAGKRILEQVGSAIDTAETQILQGIDSVGHMAKEQLSALARRYWPFLIVLLVIAVISIVVVVIRFAQGQKLELPDITSLFAAIWAALGIQQARQQNGASNPVIDKACKDARKQTTDQLQEVRAAAGQTSGQAANPPVTPPAAPEESVLDRLGGVVDVARAAILDALDRGYKQIRSDLAALEYSVAVTYPLVEYLVLNKQFGDIKGDYGFLTEIIWAETDREEEVRRVAYASFGPLGMFAFAEDPKAKGKEENKTATT
jgi:hypothetical protein